MQAEVAGFPKDRHKQSRFNVIKLSMSVFHVIKDNVSRIKPRRWRTGRTMWLE